MSNRDLLCVNASIIKQKKVNLIMIVMRTMRAMTQITQTAMVRKRMVTLLKKDNTEITHNRCSS